MYVCMYLYVISIVSGERHTCPKSMPAGRIPCIHICTYGVYEHVQHGADKRAPAPLTG